MSSIAVYLPLLCPVLLYIFHCNVQYCCISSTEMSSIAEYLPLLCPVLLYIFHSNVQYCCISSTAMSSTAVYLPQQCLVLLYIFHSSVQYCCISSTAMSSTAVYLPLQCPLLLYIFHCSVKYCCISSTAVLHTFPRDQFGRSSTHSTEHRCPLNTRETAAEREHPQQSHKQSSRHVSSPFRLRNSTRRHHSVRVSHDVPSTESFHTHPKSVLQESPQNSTHTFLSTVPAHHCTVKCWQQ